MENRRKASQFDFLSSDKTALKFLIKKTLKGLVFSMLLMIIYTSGSMAQTDLAFAQEKERSNNKVSEYKFKPITSTPSDKHVFIDFVGSGDIQKSLSDGDGVAANTGLGIIFERYNGVVSQPFAKSESIIQSFELEATINVASTADSINANFINGVLENRRNFGTYILNPISQKQSLFLNANVFFGYPDEFFGKVSPIISGLNARLITSNSIWGYGDQFENLGVISFRGGIFHEFIPDNFRLDEKGRSKYSLFIGINYAYRGVYGDITSESNEEFLKSILGTTETNYSGWELNFGFRLNNLRAEFEMPTLNAKESQVEGLTNTQFIFSIKFVGGFSLKLNEIDSNSEAVD